MVNKNSRCFFFAYAVLLEFQTEQEVTCHAMGFETENPDDGTVRAILHANMEVQDAPNAMLAK